MTRLLECALGETRIAVAPELGGALAGYAGEDMTFCALWTRQENSEPISVAAIRSSHGQTVLRTDASPLIR